MTDRVKQLLMEATKDTPPNLALLDRIERRARHRQVRKRVAVGAFSFAVSVATVAFLIAAFGGSETPQPIVLGPGEVRSVPVPEPQPITSGYGSVWTISGALETSAGVVRIDPGTDSTVLIHGTHAAQSLAVGEGYAWVTKSTSSSQLLRVDVSTNRVSGTAVLPNEIWEVATGIGRVWLASPQGVLEVDPQTLRVTTLTTQNANYLSIGAGYVWITSGNSVDELDPTTGAVVHSFRYQNPCNLVASDALVMVADCREGGYEGIDPMSNTVRFSITGHLQGIDFAFFAGHPWMSCWTLSPIKIVNGVRERTTLGTIRQLDPFTGEPTGPQASVDPGSRRGSMMAGELPIFVTADAGSFWMTHLEENYVVRIGAPTSPPVTSSRAPYVEIQTREIFDNGTLVFDPPSTGQRPGITAQQAIHIALGKNPYHLTATAQFGLFTDTSARPASHTGTQAPLTWVNVPVWLVTIHHFCSPSSGFVSSPVPRPQHPCVYREIIDASSGKDIQDFG